MTLRVRRATAADTETLVPLYRAAYDTAADLGYPNGMQAVEAEYVRGWFDEEPPSAEFVAERDDTVVGAIRVLEERDVPFLERLAVAPDAQGEGVGGRLFARAERYAREAGYDRVRLGTFTDHPFLLDFYESRGYERFTLWESDDHEYDYVGYEKRL
ncbi:GNAT family N-acetyltransferase [Halosegnis marinus]|uniref:GNAT family N-acetyltransferase n=1 Tax=Halosegnis marinus TaxID=3034023 RepID=A0ABD5ZM08_9EURY|nr:GNAT family N-acetyltransferase [Halosegnis sp. DT85]